MAEFRCPDCGAPLRAAGELCAACAFGGCLDQPAVDGALRLPGLEILGEIARGGAGIVYGARQLEPAREVALKMMLPQLAASPGAVARFRLEAATVAGLDHPALLPLYATGEHDGLPWFTMKLATGGSLAERLADYRGRWSAIAELVQTLAEAVQFAHSRGVLHRDLKPSNVLFDEAGRPFVSDFGIAKLTDTDHALTLTQNVLGTPAYVAPEVAEGGGRAATTASDVYALGAILYELLAGRPPFRGETLTHLLRQVADRTPDPLPADVPRDLGILALRALEKSPAARLPSAAEFAAELGRWRAGVPIRARPAGPFERLQSWSRRNPALAGLSALLLLGTFGGAAALWQGNRDLSRALAQARAATAAERAALREALVAQARGLRRSGQQGQSLEALRLLQRAGPGSAEDLAWRAEAAAALALPDASWEERHQPVSLRSYLSTVGLSADFTRYACAAPRESSQPGDAVLRAVDDGRIVATLPNPGAAACEHFRFSPSGLFLRVIHADGGTQLWDLVTQTPLGPNLPAVRGAPAITAFDDEDGWYWQRTDGWLVRRGRDGSTANVAVTEGALWVAPRGGGSVMVGFPDRVEARTQTLIEWRLPLACTATEPAWTADRSRLAVAERERSEVWVLSAVSGAALARLSGHSQPPSMLAFHPSGRILATLSSDRSLRWWDASSGEQLWLGSAAQRALAWSPDGRRLTAFRTQLQFDVLAVRLPEVLREFPASRRLGPEYFGLELDAARAWAVTCDPGLVRIWNLRERTVREVPCVPAGDRTAFPVDPPGTVVTSTSSSGVQRLTPAGLAAESLGPGLVLAAGPAGSGWLVATPGERKLWLWPDGDPARARLLRTGEGYFAARFSPQRDQAALLGNQRPLIEIVDLARPDLRRTLEPGAHAQVDWSPDGNHLLIGTPSEYRVLRVVDLTAIQRWTATLTGEPYARVTWSPDGRWVATQSGANEVEIRATSDWRIRHRLEAPPWVGALHDLAFSPDASRLRLFAGLHQLFEWDLTLLDLELAAIPTR
ncbi:MAG: protein kinase [Verrucomicrobia bacterium]|nr:protein kinase [Verrucomicrobiota bacterium]